MRYDRFIPQSHCKRAETPSGVESDNVEWIGAKAALLDHGTAHAMVQVAMSSDRQAGYGWTVQDIHAALEA